MKKTGIFFTYFQGERLRDFPQALAGILDRENISYYDMMPFIAYVTDFTT